MSLADILDEIPKLSFAERQEMVRLAIAIDEEGLRPEEGVILDERMDDFHRDPDAGISLDELKDRVRERLPRQ